MRISKNVCKAVVFLLVTFAFTCFYPGGISTVKADTFPSDLSWEREYYLQIGGTYTRSVQQISMQGNSIIGDYIYGTYQSNYTGFIDNAALIPVSNVTYMCMYSHYNVQHDWHFIDILGNVTPRGTDALDVEQVGQMYLVADLDTGRVVDFFTGGFNRAGDNLDLNYYYSSEPYDLGIKESYSFVPRNGITAVNNSGIDDTVTVDGLNEGDEVFVYTAATGGAMLGSGMVQSGMSEVTVSIPQLGTSSGTVYVSIKRSGETEGARIARTYSSETTNPLYPSDITATNNYESVTDSVYVMHVPVNAEIKVYSDSAGTVLIGSGVASDTSILISISQLGIPAGSVYVSVTRENKLESARVKADYANEPTTSAPLAANITTVNNKAGIDDMISVTGLEEGDVINVYDSATGGTLIITSTVGTGETSATMIITQLGQAAGNVYISAKKDGMQESTRTVKAYTSEISPALSGANITVVNNYIGTDDTVTVTAISEGDIVNVYNASTGGNLIGTGTAGIGQASVVIAIPQLGSAAGIVYVSVTKVNKLESARTSRTYTTEPTTSAPVAANITVTNNKAGIDDTVVVPGLMAGDTVKVYNSSTGGTLLGTAIAGIGETSVTIVIPQLGQSSGNIYITVKNPDKLESARTAKGYDSEISVAPAAGSITVVNNYVGTDDTVTVTGRTEGDIINVYNASSGGTLLGTGTVEAGQTSVVISIPQLGSAAGYIYVSAIKVNKLESPRTSRQYLVEPTTTAPLAANITVTNNKAGMDDTVVVTGRVQGDLVRVYNAATGGTLLGTYTVEEDQISAILVIPQLGTGAGNVYVTVKQEGKLESARTAKAYTSETSAAPSASSITVVNNYVGTDDTVTVTALAEGDIINVYNASSGGTLLGTGTVEAGQTSVLITIPQIGSAAGNIYVSVIKVNKLESPRATKAYAVEPTTTAPSAASITATNNKAGIDDTVVVTGRVQGDLVRVYNAATGGTLLGTYTVEEDQTSAIFVIPQLGTGAGNVYVTVKQEGKLESARTVKAYTSETSGSPSASNITVVNNYVGTDDTVTVISLIEGDVVNVYNASTGGTLLGTGTVEAGQTSVVIFIPQIGSAAGNIYVSVTNVNKLESPRRTRSHASEPTTTAPSAANITVTNNKAGIDDTVTVVGLAVGDIVNVYNASTGGTLLGTATVEAGETVATVVIPQLGQAAGNVYISVKNYNKLESSRTARAYTSETSTAPTAATITVVNNSVGIDDTVTVTGLVEGDAINVYNAGTGGTLLGTGTVGAGQTSVVISIPQIGPAAGNVYVSVIKFNKLESSRTTKAFTAEV